MKNNYLYNWVVIVFMMLQMLAFTSCSDDDDNSGWPTETDKTEIFIERFSTLVTNLTALRDGATYGELKDNYPVSSKAMLDDEIVYLEETIAKLKEGNKKLADSEADRIIREANQIEKNSRKLFLCKYLFFGVFINLFEIAPGNLQFLKYCVCIIGNKMVSLRPVYQSFGNSSE